MTKPPLVTIIIPVYNSEFIDTCLKSCFDQKLSGGKLEVIVVDDASTDNTVQRLIQLQQIFTFKVVQLDKNGGPARARNAGLKDARGEFVALLDSDDSMHPDKLSIQLDILQKKPTIHAVISGIEEIDASGVHLRKLSRPFPGEREAQAKVIFLDKLHTITSTLLFKRSLLESTGYMNENLLNLEDMEFALRLLKYTTLYYVKETLTIRRVLSTGLSQSVSEALFLTSRSDFLASALELYPSFSKIEEVYWSLNYARLGRILQRQSQPDRARVHYLASVRSQFNLIAVLGFILSFFPATVQRQLATINWKKK